jgi:PSP1 C-terminal conserved region
MSTGAGKPGFTPRTNMPAFGAFGSQQPASLLFEKSNPGMRRSTPDSEALASSDDEVDQARSAATSQKLPKPTRRTSWLNDVSAANAGALNRKPSLTAQYSPSTSNPGTPGTEPPSWSSLGNQASVAWNNAPTSSPWGSIWSQDNRGGPPSRLHEVMATNESGLPFSIPLQPTPKSYRSQSYSVGQLDSGSVVPTSGQIPTSTEGTRTRLGGQNPSLQRRTSRNNGLGLDSGGLGRVREVEDDEEEAGRMSHPSDSYHHPQSRQMERLQQENAQLRQANQLHDRTISATSSTTIPATSAFRGSRIQPSVPEEYDTAVDDHESMSGSGTLPRLQNGMRRLSEQSGIPFDRQNLTASEASARENTRKAQWSTSLGFGSIPEAPQSRRHSLADVPTRHGSFSSHGIAPAFPYLTSPGADIAVEDEHAPAYENSSQEVGSQGDDRESALTLLQPTQAQMEHVNLRFRSDAAAYFATTDVTRRAAEAHVHSSFMGNHPYSPQSHLGTYMGPASQPLHIVNFKCCRSDVFYVQDGTGLQVNVGDLVVVEADRGTDLGTVQHVNVTWDEARRYKEHYAEEHYKWLMMFSQQSRNGGPNVLNPNGLPGRPGSAVGGMGPPGHQAPHDSGHTGDLKPKMIKRLAQNHEIQTLKDKEGNEAKAKRNCQQKVLEHRLNMEILDAEFQM